MRKPKKLPAPVAKVNYDLEYGITDSLEIHLDAIEPGQRAYSSSTTYFATGGTMQATVQLVRQLGGEIVSIGFAIELDFSKAAISSSSTTSLVCCIMTSKMAVQSRVGLQEYSGESIRDGNCESRWSCFFASVAFAIRALNQTRTFLKSRRLHPPPPNLTNKLNRQMHEVR